jgi:uncharacterized protein YcnI
MRTRTRSLHPPRFATRETLLVLLIAFAMTLAVVSLGFAHATVWPKATKAGGHERYVIRVPNEKNVPTLRVEIKFPAELRVTSFADVPGWQLEVLTDSAKRIVGAVWTGSLPPHRFAEFPFVAANPKTEGKLVWPVYQTYAEGPRVDWVGPEGSKAPASVTTIGPASQTVEVAAASAAAAPTSSTAQWVPWSALALSVVSLGLSLRRRNA